MTMTTAGNLSRSSIQTGTTLKTLYFMTDGLGSTLVLLPYVDPTGHMDIRQIGDLVLGLFDVIEDNLVATFTWDTYVGLYDFGKGVIKGDITLVDIGKSLGGSAQEKVDYFVKNTPKVFGGKPTDHEVRVYVQQLGEVLSLIVRSPSALKILGDISPDIAK